MTPHDPIDASVTDTAETTPTAAADADQPVVGAEADPAADRPTRRRLLVGSGTVGAALLAGCTNFGSGDSADDQSAGGADDDGASDAAAANDYYDAASYAEADHPISEPAPFDADQHCPVCGMRVENSWGWRCQVAHADATGLFFDTPGCLLAYYVLPDAHATAEPIEAVWFSDFETQDLFAASEGYLVAETDLDRQTFLMGGSPLPVETHEQATAYVDEYDDLSADDIVTIDDVDRELAEFYRGDRMP